ncbi:MAG: hypothetical protein WC313_08715 [Candidatus Kapaibacterium sp.]|jgi:hypothetical protein|nr:hypothetical protein [Candidatus Kapabacteria bacterium]
MKYIYALIILAAMIFISACSENSTNITAEKVTVDQLATIPGYTWFNHEIDKYEPLPSVIQEIKETYNPSLHKFVVFMKPSCSCPGKHLQSPGFMKVLQESDIDLNLVEFFTMSNLTNNHPYSEMIILKELPTIIVLKATEPVYSVSDTLNSVNSPNSTPNLTIENALLNALRK